MSITPQAIKDQEFQIKFRGYDAIEVKAYLELLAEEFFELHEGRGRQEEEYEELEQKNRELQAEQEKLIRDAQQQGEELEARSQKSADKEGEISELKTQIKELKESVQAAEKETEQELQELSERESELLGEIDDLKRQLQDEKDKKADLEKESDKLRTEVDFLEKQIAELRTEDVEFKSTIVAAQKFADDVKNKAEEEAVQLLEDARDEVEMFRREAEERLADLPVEIEELKEKKVQVREELRAVLNTYLVQLDVAEEKDGGDNGEDLSDLFQSISLPEDSDLVENAGGEEASS